MAEIKSQATKGGKKNRKFGRHKTKSGAMARYRNEARWMTNKERRKARHAKRMARKNDRFTVPTPRGMARALRRVGLQLLPYEGEAA